MTDRATPEKGARSTHRVYRVGEVISWDWQPCFCPAREDHPISQTRPLPPGSDGGVS